jgi:hypothetical protein
MKMKAFLTTVAVTAGIVVALICWKIVLLLVCVVGAVDALYEIGKLVD